MLIFLGGESRKNLDSLTLASVLAINLQGTALTTKLWKLYDWKKILPYFAILISCQILQFVIKVNHMVIVCVCHVCVLL